MYCPQNINDDIPQFLIIISPNTSICYSFDINPETLFRAILEISKEENVSIKREYPLWIFDLDQFKKDPESYYKKYEQPKYEDITIKAGGLYIIPFAGDIIINRSPDKTKTALKQHASILLGNRYSNVILNYVLDCVGSGCGENLMLINQDFNLGYLISYKGVYQNEIRSEVLVIGKEISKLSSYSILKVCKAVLPYGCFSNNKILNNIIDIYEKQIDQQQPIDQLCSSFVILVYLLAFRKVFNEHKKEPDFEKIFSLNPDHCLPRDFINWAESHPDNWYIVEIQNNHYGNFKRNIPDVDENIILTGYLQIFII